VLFSVGERYTEEVKGGGKARAKGQSKKKGKRENKGQRQISYYRKLASAGKVKDNH